MIVILFIITENLALSDPTWKGEDFAFLSREERFTDGVKKGVYLRKKMKELGLVDRMDKVIFER